MRVVIIIDSLAIGGAQKHARQLACLLHEVGHTPEVVVLNDKVDPVYTAALSLKGIHVSILGKACVLSGLAVFWLAYKHLSEKVDLVVTLLFVSNLVGRLGAYLAGGVPVVCAMQARNIDHRSWQLLLTQATAPLSLYTISNSRAALLWAIANEGVNPRRSCVVYNMLDSIPPVSSQGPTDPGLRRIVSFGRLTKQKGFDVLIEAVALSARELRGVCQFDIYGEGVEEQVLRRAARARGVEDLITFNPPVRNTAAVLASATAYVQPSRFEGMPHAVVEALQHGKPVIASAVDGIRELGTLDGLSLVPSNEPAVLAREMIASFTRPAISPAAVQKGIWDLLKESESRHLAVVNAFAHPLYEYI